MSKHRELHDMLVTRGAGAAFLTHAPNSLLPDRVSWYLRGEPLAYDDAHALIEHAGLLWLLGRATARDSSLSMTSHSLNGGNYQIALDRRLPLMGDTLIDALHAAVKREVGDGEDQGDWMANEPLDAEDYDPLGEEARDGK